METSAVDMEKLRHLLIIDDDEGIRVSLERYLKRHGFRVSLAPTGARAIEVQRDEPASLAILDLGLPDMDGIDLLPRLRSAADLPVIMLTGRGDEIDRIVGLEVGADDYVTKPFNPRELLARIRSVLKRTERPAAAVADSPRDSAGSGRRFGPWLLDTARRELRAADGAAARLTYGEYDLLHVFVTHPGRVLSRDLLLDLSRRREIEPFDRSIDIMVSRLRRRIEPDPKNPRFITTVRGGGYMFVPEPPEQATLDV